jgi:hypothetical protein
MAATADSSHPPPLGVHRREQVGHELQSFLVELVDLSLLGMMRAQSDESRGA